eukprot:Hpha_TRINITY_DN15916_c0_g1::TRINITY_DN15916_c0_g1_i1::g.72686::m.72686
MSGRVGAKVAQRYHYHGPVDRLLGIDRFWTEKWLLFCLWVQDFALLWMWPMRWPWHFWGRSHFLLFSLLDFRTRRWQMQACESGCMGNWPDCKPDGCTFSLDVIKVFEDADTPQRSILGNALTIGGGGIIFLIWVAMGSMPEFGLIGPALAKNVERALMPVLMVLYTPFLISCLYAACDFKSFTVEQWRCKPDSQSGLWLGLGAIFAVGFPLLVFHRTASNVVFESRLRHETMLRKRELEYALRLNTIYRDRRLWLLSCFTQAGAYTMVYHLLHKLTIVVLLALSRSDWAITAFVTNDQDAPEAPELLPDWNRDIISTFTNVIVAMFLVPALAISTGFLRLYRVQVTNVLFCLFLWGHTVNSALGSLNVMGVRNPILVDKDARILLAWFNFSIAAAFVFALMFFYFWTHEFLAVLPCCRDQSSDRVRDKLAGSRKKGALQASEHNAIHQHLGRSLPLLIQDRLKERREDRGEICHAPSKAKLLRKSFVSSCNEVSLTWSGFPAGWPLKQEEPQQESALCSDSSDDASLAPGVMSDRKRKKWKSADVSVYFKTGVSTDADEFKRDLLCIFDAATDDTLLVQFKETEDLRHSLRVRFTHETEAEAAQAAFAFYERVNDPADEAMRGLNMIAAELANPAANINAMRTGIQAPSEIGSFANWGSMGAAGMKRVTSESMMSVGLAKSLKSEGSGQSSKEESAADKVSVCSALSENYEMEMLQNLCGKDLAEAELFGDYWGDEDGDDLVAYDRGYRCFPPSKNVMFTWPVGRALIAEIIRENRTNHFLDVLREAQAVLMEVSFMHSTPELVRAETLLFHVRRLRRCLRQCSKLRIVHHLYAIHPLAPTIEDILDEMVFELKKHKDVAMAVGARATKLPIVSTYLHHRMAERERYMVLYAPVMRRVLLKLLCLRMFQELVSGKGAGARILPGGRSKNQRRSTEELFGGGWPQQLPWGATSEEEPSREGTMEDAFNVGLFTAGGMFRRATDATSDSGEAMLVDDADELGLGLSPEFRHYGAAIENDEFGDREEIMAEEFHGADGLALGFLHSKAAAAHQAHKRQQQEAGRSKEFKNFDKQHMDAYKKLRSQEEIEWEVWHELLADIHKDAAEDAARNRSRFGLCNEETAARDVILAEEETGRGHIWGEAGMSQQYAADKQQLHELERDREAQLRAHQMRQKLERKSGDANAALAELEDLMEPEEPPPPEETPEQVRKMRKKFLAGELARFKKEYKDAHGKEPTKRIFASDPYASPLWEEYTAIQEGRWKAPGEWEGEAQKGHSDPEKRRKKEIVPQLNAWKAAYKEANGKEPKKKVLQEDPSIAPLFAEYQAMQEGRWKDTYGDAYDRRGSAAPSPEPPAPGGEDGSPRASPAPDKLQKRRKKELAKALNVWKAAYKDSHGKEPSARQLRNDPTVAPLYAEFQACQDGTWPEKYGPGGAAATETEVDAPTETQLDAPTDTQMDAGTDTEAHTATEGGVSPTRSRRGSASPEKQMKRRKKELARVLNSWKASYREEHGKDPTTRNLREDPAIAPLHAEFQACADGTWLEKYGAASEAAAPGVPEPEARGRSESPAPGGDRDASPSPAPGPDKRAKKRKKELAHALNVWKAEYRDRNGKDPTTRNIREDPDIAPLHAEYQSIQAGTWAETHGTAPAAEAPVPTPAGEEAPGAEGGGSVAGGEEERSASPSPGGKDKAAKRRRKELAAELNRWKAAYKEQHGKEPTKRVLREDPEISALYLEYQELQSAKNKERAGSPEPGAQEEHEA